MARKPVKQAGAQSWPADSVERRKIASLVPHARNARTHSIEQVAQIARSMTEFGWTNPILVDENDGIIAGHGRVLGAHKNGWLEAPVVIARGWSDAKKRAYVIADNQIALNAGWDESLLKIDEADLIFSCPPYGDLEVYSENALDLSTMGRAAFLTAYRVIIAAAVAKLRPDRFACFVVGDYRDKAGFYCNFVSETIGAFEAAGARLYNEAILVTAAGSLPIRAGKQFASTRKLGKTHQQCLVFCKGDPRKATEACGPVEVPEMDDLDGNEITGLSP